jgi:hypothetical protein
MVNQDSTAAFGVGAFLLAAAEMSRFLVPGAGNQSTITST